MTVLKQIQTKINIQLKMEIQMKTAVSDVIEMNSLLSLYSYHLSTLK